MDLIMLIIYSYAVYTLAMCSGNNNYIVMPNIAKKDNISLLYK